MRATYCPTCDETRWQLVGLPVERATTCAGCGSELQTERRRPGRAAAGESRFERREAVAERPAPLTPA
jgi:ssDNA-binding Zn-finger/Zn-ribbon topoisomerase 1